MQQMLMMPMECIKCKELFDLSYDLDKERDLQEKAVGAKKKMKGYLCWDCRP